MSKQQYQPTKLRPIIQTIARIVQKNPSIADNPDYLMATIGENIPGFHDKTKCVNCGAGMAEYLYVLGVFDAMLLYAMAKTVRRSLDEGKPFTEANVVHLPTMLDAGYTVKSRCTYGSKLGLIAKHKKDNKHVRGEWVITTRGWQALRGEPVPKAVRIFRGLILDRPEEHITLGETFRGHTTKIETSIKKGKKPRTDYRNQIEGYHPNEWVNIAGMHQGELL